MVTLLDGGMGREIQERRPEAAHGLWSASVLFDEPDLVVEIHREYIDAGAVVITTNNYSTIPSYLRKAGMQDRYRELTRLAATLARRAVRESGRAARAGGKRVAVAGSLPPLEESYRADLVPPPEIAQPIYQGVVEALRDDVDLFICETMSSADRGTHRRQCGVGARPRQACVCLMDPRRDAGSRAAQWRDRQGSRGRVGGAWGRWLPVQLHPPRGHRGRIAGTQGADRQAHRLLPQPTQQGSRRLDPRQRDHHRAAQRPPAALVRGGDAAQHRGGRDLGRRLLRHRPVGHPRLGATARVGVRPQSGDHASPSALPWPRCLWRAGDVPHVWPGRDNAARPLRPRPQERALAVWPQPPPPQDSAPSTALARRFCGADSSARPLRTLRRGRVGAGLVPGLVPARRGGAGFSRLPRECVSILETRPKGAPGRDKPVPYDKVAASASSSSTARWWAGRACVRST